MLTLEKIKIYAPNIDWTDLPKRFMNPGELEVLCEIMRQINPKTVIEFGINVGRTAKAILRHTSSIETYVGIDVEVGYVTEKTVQRNEIPEQPGELVTNDARVRIIVTENGSRDLKSSDLPFADAVFIDGDHSYKGVQHDTMLARSRVKSGGIIMWHDYHDMGCVDVRDFLHDEVKKGHKIYHVENTWLAYEIIK